MSAGLLTLCQGAYYSQVWCGLIMPGMVLAALHQCMVFALLTGSWIRRIAGFL